MASVQRYSTRDGIRYRARWRDPDGSSKSHTFDRKGDADRFATRVEHDMFAGAYVDPQAGRITVREYGEEWRKAQLQHAPSTAKDVETALRVHLYPALGDRPLGSLRASDVQGWVAGMAKGVAPSTARKHYSFLATMLKAALRDGLLSKTPCLDINLPKVETKRVAPLSIEQLAALIDETPEHYRPLVLFCAGTGARAREAFGVTVDRFNFLRREVVIDRQLATRDGSAAWRAPKTPSSVRTVPLDDGVIDAVAAHLAEHPAGPDGLIFTTPEGRALDLRRAYGFGDRRLGWFRAAVRRAGLPADTTFHDLRHFYASLLIRHGLSIKTVQARLGHKSAQETLDTYSHLWHDDEEQTRNVLNEAFASLRSVDSKPGDMARS